jgi:acylpyruvate hydrolase
VRLATIRTGGGTWAVRVDSDVAVETGHRDLGALLREADWHERAATASGPAHAVADLDFAPLITQPDKIICVGLNYRQHILEMGRELPEHPTLFAKYTCALVGANDPVVLPAVSRAVDWEAELVVVIGRRVRHASEGDAQQAIAGFTVINDVTGRDWQYRTKQWLQGKTFESSTPIGPWLVTDGADEPVPSFVLSCEVDGETVQKADTADLVFGPAALVSYISRMMTLEPGDIIATGTPGGVGHARKPPRYLTPGSRLVTRIEGVGELDNLCVAEAALTI